MGLAHWDDVERHHRAKGEMDATWQMLGAQRALKGVGVNRVRVAPGMLPNAAALTRRLRGDLLRPSTVPGLRGRTARCTRCGRGDCVIHQADHHEHTFVAGPNGLDFLVF